MNISAPFIARPIATCLLALAVLLCGVLGYRALPVSALPQVDFPTIQITTQLPGASPQTVATLITASLERQFGQITGLSSMTSTSSEGTSQITLQFGLSRSMDSAAQDVQAAINSAGSTLPNNLPYPPTYAKVNPADAPILTLALTSDSTTIDRISDAADTLLQPKLSQIDGVGKVTVQGRLRPAVRVRIDPARLASYGLSTDDVRTAVAAANVNGAKGGFDGPRQSFSLAANDQLINPAAYRDLVIAWKGGAPVHLRDVGSVVGGVENDRVAASYNGKPAVVLDIQRQPGANIVATVDEIKRQLPMLQRALPAAIAMQIAADRTVTIRASVHDVQFTLALSIGLVVLVIFLFLRSWRATVIPAVALPLSLIGTFGVMALCGYSLDNLSLMALTVATGFVVDDAIVMIENVVRYIEEGVPPLQAAYKGAKQIGFTIVSLTVSLIAVFIPLLFMTGVVGRLFNEFAVVLSTSVIVSAVVSLTVTPMMCGRMLRAHEAPGWVSRTFERGFEATLRWYMGSLNWALRRQGFVLLVAIASLAGTIALYVVAPKGFLPQQDTGTIVIVSEAEQSASIPRMAGLQAKLVDIAQADPAVEGVVSFVGAGSINATPNTGRITLTLKPRGQREPADAVIDRLAEAHVRHPRPVGVHATGAGYPDRHPDQPHPVSIHADGHRRRRTRAVGAALARPAAIHARSARRCQRPADRRLRHAGAGGPRRGDAPGRHHAGGAGRVVQPVRPAPDQHHLCPEQSIPRGAGGRSVLASRSRQPGPPARARPGRRAGAALRDCPDREDHRAAGCDAPVAVSRRDPCRSTWPRAARSATQWPR